MQSGSGSDVIVGSVHDHVCTASLERAPPESLLMSPSPHPSLRVPGGRPKALKRPRTLAALAAVLTLGLLTGCAEAADPADDTGTTAAQQSPSEAATESSEGTSTGETAEDSAAETADETSGDEEGKAGSSTPGTASAMLDELEVKGRAPKTGYDGHVEPSDIAEAAPTAGLSQTSNVSLSEGWVGTRLVPPKASAQRRR